MSLTMARKNRWYRSAHCSGWDCLTTAEQFGTIFSSVVISIILLLAYAYYMGRRTESHREKTTIQLPGGRRVRRNRSLPPDVALTELPIAQQWPGHPPNVLYQPVVYNLTPNQPPVAQPYIIGGPYPQFPPQHGPPALPPVQLSGPTYLTVPTPGPMSSVTSFHPATRVPNYSRPTNRASSSRFDRVSEPRQPSLWQRLGRLFRQPVGRASTIASSSLPSTPRLNARRSSTITLERTNSSRGVPGQVKSPGIGEPSMTHPAARPWHGQPECSSPETNSLRSDNATVRSDDFELSVLQPSNFLGAKLESDHDRRLKQGHGGAAKEDSQQSQSIPSTPTECPMKPRRVSSKTSLSASSGTDRKGKGPIQDGKGPMTGQEDIKGTHKAGTSQLSGAREKEAGRREWESGREVSSVVSDSGGDDPVPPRSIQ